MLRFFGYVFSIVVHCLALNADRWQQATSSHTLASLYSPPSFLSSSCLSLSWLSCCSFSLLYPASPPPLPPCWPSKLIVSPTFTPVEGNIRTMVVEESGLCVTDGCGNMAYMTTDTHTGSQRCTHSHHDHLLFKYAHGFIGLEIITQ